MTGDVSAMICPRHVAEIMEHPGVEKLAMEVARLRVVLGVVTKALEGPAADVERALRVANDLHDAEIEVRRAVREWAVAPAPSASQERAS